MRRLPAVLLAAWGLLAAACAPQPLTVTPRPVVLHLAVSDACEPPVRALALAYHRQRPWVAIRMDVLNDARALERLEAGAVDGAALIWTGDAPLWTHPFTDDALALIVHPAVPVDGLTRAQLREVLRGRVGDWSDGTPVQVVSREEGAGTYALLKAAVLGPWDFTLTARVVADDGSVVDGVARTPGAIGYVPLHRATAAVRVLTLEGQPPAPVPEYPLFYACRWAARDEPVGELRDWMQWTLSPEGQSVLGR